MDLGFINYVPRLQMTLTKALTYYFETDAFDESRGNIEEFNYADCTQNINDICTFAFRRFKDDDGDPTDDFEITLCQNEYGVYRVIWEGTFDINEVDIYPDEKMDEEKLKNFVNLVVKMILARLAKFRDIRKVPLCMACNAFGQDEKEFCSKCEMKCAFNKDVCAICLDEEDKVSVWVKLDKCNHVFHVKCVNKLFEKHRSEEKMCPLCRKEFHIWQKIVL